MLMGFYNMALSRQRLAFMVTTEAEALAAMEVASVEQVAWRDEPPQLTLRELEMVGLMVEGLGDREVAERMGIGYESARSLGKSLRRKLGAGSRGQAAAKALQLGLARLSGR